MPWTGPAGPRRACPGPRGHVPPDAREAERPARRGSAGRQGARDLDPYAVAEQMRAVSGAGTFDPDPKLDRKLTWAEAGELAGREGFTVGGHSHTHGSWRTSTATRFSSRSTRASRCSQRALGEPYATTPVRRASRTATPTR